MWFPFGLCATFRQPLQKEKRMRSFHLRIVLPVLCWLLLAPVVLAGQTVRYWYHVDNPDNNTIPELVAEFEKQNPDISIKAETVAWNSYYDNLYTSIIGGNAPDCAMIKLMAMPQLLEMDALVPLNSYIEKWDKKDDILPDLWSKVTAANGKIYLLPMQYIVSYLYIRKDLFDKYNVKIPTTMDEFLAAAKALTLDTTGDGRIDLYGFGYRGGKAGQEHWGVFVLPDAAEMTSEQLSAPSVNAANQFVIDLFRVHKVMPPSAPNDGFNEITTGFRSGLTAMTIHHIGSSQRMVEALGDKVSAVPVPKAGRNGGGWTNFGDEENAIFSASKNKEAAWKWISFLATAEYNNKLVQSTGQLPVTKTGSANWNVHEKRFLDATIASLPFAHTLPLTPATQEFVNVVWPMEMQRAMLGQITSQEMLKTFSELFNKK